MKSFTLPSLYAIVDAEVLAASGFALDVFAVSLRDSGVRLVQYRDKMGTPQQILSAAAVLREIFAKRDEGGPLLIMNDRADLAVLAGFDGVHVGQGDLSPDDARRVVGGSRVVGVSTHTEAQVREAALTSTDYIAFGPIFATRTKSDTEPVVGLDGLRSIRTLTTRPLVAIGGISEGNAARVIEAGADSVAMISALVPREGDSQNPARAILDALPRTRFAKV